MIKRLQTLETELYFWVVYWHLSYELVFPVSFIQRIRCYSRSSRQFRSHDSHPKKLNGATLNIK